MNTANQTIVSPLGVFYIGFFVAEWNSSKDEILKEEVRQLLRVGDLTENLHPVLEKLEKMADAQHGDCDSLYPAKEFLRIAGYALVSRGDTRAKAEEATGHAQRDLLLYLRLAFEKGCLTNMPSLKRPYYQPDETIVCW